MVTAGKSLAMAKVSRDLYRRAIAVMKGTEVLGNFVSLNEEESYNVEYWPLELYKLTLAPPEAEFSRKIAFVTGSGRNRQRGLPPPCSRRRACCGR